MRRIFAMLLALTLVFALAGCGKNTEAETNPTETTGVSIAPLPHAYADILNELLGAFPWDDGEDPICAAYPQLSDLYRDHPEVADIGFALIDLDHDGQEELVISALYQGYVYDLFTMVNDQAVHLFSGDARNCVTLREGGIIEVEWSSTDNGSGFDFYQLSEGQLLLRERVPTDAEDTLTQYRDDHGLLTPEHISLGDFTETGIPSSSSPLYGVSKTEEGYYYITFSDEAGNIIYEDPATDREPRITRLSDAVYELLTQTGTDLSTNYAVYCNAKTGEVSNVFSYVLAATEEYVVFVTLEEGVAYVNVEGSFDRELYQEKLPLTDAATTEQFIVSCVFNEDGNAVVTYLAGEALTETQLSFVMPQ